MMENILQTHQQQRYKKFVNNIALMQKEQYSKIATFNHDAVYLKQV